LLLTPVGMPVLRHDDSWAYQPGRATAAAGYEALLTVDMLKSGTRTVGIDVRVK
jgi:hypothetical protein